MGAYLTDSLATTDALSRVFGDASLLQAMLDFEVALARAEARAGIVPLPAADAIAGAAKAEHFDAEALAREARTAGTLAIPLVRLLKGRVETVDAAAAAFVHRGATSQDVADSAIVLVLKQARPLLAADHRRLDTALRQLSDRHAATIMLGRTLLQPAPPITFGLKVAGWVAALARGWDRLDRAYESAMVVQLGGASGTLAALGDRGLQVMTAVAGELGLAPAPAWHTDRHRLAALIASAGIYTATLGKIARDLALLMQDEVAEAAEPGGGSSTMPHKRNPVGCAIAIAAATRMPGLVASFLHGATGEHERAVGGWQAEWPTIAASVQATGAALAAMAGAVEELQVHPDRMRANIEKTNGVIFAERVALLATDRVGRQAADALVRDALDRVRTGGQRLKEALASMPETSRALSAAELESIDAPEQYLGEAEALRITLLS
jgi:3-carboxy-cis,cis-muconate cycloisomerase